jgi:hypothetical protein
MNKFLTAVLLAATLLGGVPAMAQVPPHNTPVVGAHFLSAATNNSTSIKSTGGQVWQVTVINTTSSAADLRLYNSAAAPTCSSATGVVWNIPIPANTTAAGVVFSIPTGLFFTKGIGVCLTASNADNDNTNTVTGLNVNIAFN